MKNLMKVDEANNRTELSRKVKSKELKRVVRGVYAKDIYYDMLEVYSLRYPNAIFTLDTLFSIYGMTDHFIERYSMAFPRGSRSIKDSRIRQIRQETALWEIGVTTIVYRGIEIRVYDKERLLIELFRFEKTLSRSLFKEVIEYYRSIVTEDFRVNRFREYCLLFPRSENLLRRFEREII